MEVGITSTASTSTFTSKGVAQPGWHTLSRKQYEELEVGSIVSLKTPIYEFIVYQLVDIVRVEVESFSFDGEFGYIQTPYSLYNVRIVE